MIKSTINRPWQRWINRRHPAHSGQQEIRHQQLYILPTRYGCAFSFMVLTLLVGALNYQLNLGLLFAFLLIGIGQTMMLKSYANLLALRLEVLPISAVFAGEHAAVLIRFENKKDITRSQLHVSCRDSAIATLSNLPPWATQDVTLRLPCPQRGAVTLPRLRLESTQPMALFRCWSFLNSPQSLWVYPAPEENPPPPPLGHHRSTGQTLSNAHGHDEFNGLRVFQRGDAKHAIAWKHSAHGEQLLVKHFQSPTGESRYFHWDDVQDLELELALSRLCAWILAAQERGQDYGLKLPNAHFAPALGAIHQQRCLLALAQFTPPR
ncbi:DUF58 domain-containing protein [Deefgea sp. CFH1-16]|uniref:DUF58 domain-containing protein n=1 Tax=Deefgea sp. CFH1-16 TaxID=2675457 RepID=UPI0015F5BF4A|nr:DUF58 domain-containing protein [Deefgea sp. CFH1-16]MBM5573123.1 DUF58 domain-containing protein [Deefgea sp. CFH1-16]